MIDNENTGGAPDDHLEDFAAELTSAVYPLVLRHGLNDRWLKVELALHRALVETVKKWARKRPPAASPDELDAWREGLLSDLTARAFSVVVQHGIQGPLLELELGMYRAVRPVIGRCSQGRESE